MSDDGNGYEEARKAALDLKRKFEAEEEEKLTPYSGSNLTEPMEYKIVRSAFTQTFKPDLAFSTPARLRNLLEEEAKSGWELMEKFDDFRIRLSRPASCRLHDPSLLKKGVDPYKTTYHREEYEVAFKRYNWKAFALFIIFFLIVLSVIIFITVFAPAH